MTIWTSDHWLIKCFDFLTWSWRCKPSCGPVARNGVTISYPRFSNDWLGCACGIQITKLSILRYFSIMASDKKFVVITGVSTGIGWDASQFLIKHGYHIFGSVRNKKDADSCKKDFGPNFTPLIMDVRDAEAIEGAVKIVSPSDFISLLNNCLWNHYTAYLLWCLVEILPYRWTVFVSCFIGARASKWPEIGWSREQCWYLALITCIVRFIMHVQLRSFVEHVYVGHTSVLAWVKSTGVFSLQCACRYRWPWALHLHFGEKIHGSHWCQSHRDLQGDQGMCIHV